ncbi:hypothetical protein B0A48_08398 [Cryoendolithus antarcticus]|uniref:NADH:flavin oxidoreductase/NADH oxidase N-terminal domain-containing protein n=1 Tax=Cryoendolithus antarcticus TaxID=1507870 RepID=A0A1V8T5B9_9PEZI|nr:hypothetical protein B0A48_08398 [Cryoendolithus antarcticus]
MYPSSVRYNSPKTDASPLGQSLTFPFSNRTAPNRFLKGAMTERLSSWSPTSLPLRGVPSKAIQDVYRHWGRGEIGLSLTGNILIECDHLEARGNPIITPDDPLEGERFGAFTEMAKDRIQPHPISASDVQSAGTVIGLTFAKPRAATKVDIARIIEGFAHAAEYLEKAGFDGVELHGAHGLENRARLITEIAAAIQSRTERDFVLGIKLNSVEFQDGGFTTEDARDLCALLEKSKFDFVELSGGTYESLAFTHKRDSTRAREAFFLDFAELIAPALTKTKVYLTGGFKTVPAMVKALNIVDGIGLGRPLCQVPFLCRDILAGSVTGAIEQAVDRDDFGVSLTIAGAHITQLSKNEKPVDMSDEANVKAFMKDMGEWRTKAVEDQAMVGYGNVEISSVSLPRDIILTSVPTETSWRNIMGFHIEAALHHIQRASLQTIRKFRTAFLMPTLGIMLMPEENIIFFELGNDIRQRQRDQSMLR